MHEDLRNYEYVFLYLIKKKKGDLQAERLSWTSEQNNTNQLLEIPLFNTRRYFAFNGKDLGTRAKFLLLPEAGPGFSSYAFNPQNNLIRWIMLLSPFYRWKNGSIGRLINLPQITRQAELRFDPAGTWRQSLTHNHSISWALPHVRHCGKRISSICWPTGYKRRKSGRVKDDSRV